jgi:hypothetical protein
MLANDADSLTAATAAAGIFPAVFLIGTCGVGRWCGTPRAYRVARRFPPRWKERLVMLRQLFVSLVLSCSLALTGGGCRSCQSCHDYDGPVADCGTCGCGRAGSVNSGCACGSCGPDGCAPGETYVDGPAVMTDEMSEQP